MVTGMFAVTWSAVTTNDALVAPAGTVTLEGTVAAEGLLLDNLIVAPPAGATAANVTVPDPVVPLLTVAGGAMEDISTGTTERVTERE
jgi:hypothetical protein